MYDNRRINQRECSKKTKAVLFGKSKIGVIKGRIEGAKKDLLF